MALLPRSTALTVLMSDDSTLLRLPNKLPDVTETRALPTSICAAWHCSPVSEAHDVCSHPVRPTLIAPQKLVSPNFAPCTLTLKDPVPPVLPRRSALPSPRSTLYPTLALPARNPTVNSSARLRILPCPARHRVDVSDSHVVPSQAVRPTRAAPV